MNSEQNYISTFSYHIYLFIQSINLYLGNNTILGDRTVYRASVTSAHKQY